MALHYSAFGLSVSANRPIPGLAPVAEQCPVDTWIRLGALPAPFLLAAPDEIKYVSPDAASGGPPALTAWTVAGGAFWRLRYADGTEFAVDRRGREVWATWPASLTVEDTATYLLGPILGLVLRLRGVTCLHASAVALGGRALVLVGPPGAGKSTVAAVLAHAGCPVVADDVVPLAERDGAFFAQPAYPHLRLWPDSAAAIYGPAAALPRLTPTWDKRYVDLTVGNRFEARALPIGGLYLLDERRAEPFVAPFERVTGHRALLALIANTYVNYLPGPDTTGAELGRLHRLLACVPLRRVHAPTDPARLPQLARALVGDFQAHAAMPAPSDDDVQR